MEQETKTRVSRRDRGILMALVIFAIVVAGIAIIGMLLLKAPEPTIQGQADCDEVRVSGKTGGRIVKFYVHEGDVVHQGDTLASIYSSTLDAKLFQAQSMQNAAAAQSRKASNGTRSELKSAAYNVWQQAIAAETIARKTYERVNNLYEQGVATAQKRDEARAALDAATAQVQAAKSQYDMAVNGAQQEDKQAAGSMADAARGSVMEVQSLLEDQFLVAPCDGEVSEIYPHEGELVMMGTPVMTLSRLQNMWASFAVREDHLDSIAVGKTIDVIIPALGGKETQMQVYYIHDMGSYATCQAAKAYGDYDRKTFEVKARPLAPIENLRPGMSVILKEQR